MRLALPLLLLTLLLFLILFWVQGSDSTEALTVVEVSIVEAASDNKVDLDLELTPTTRETVAVESTGVSETAVKAEAAVPAEVGFLTGAGDLKARRPITIRVLDDTDTPIAGASVKIWAMRRADEPGSHYGYRGDQPFGETDREGRVELKHWEWVTIDSRIGEVTLRISHPDFVTFTGDLNIGPGEHEVQLERGSTVVVTAWFGDTSNVIQDLKLQVDREAKLSSSDWSSLDDGRLATTRIPLGPHWIVASYEDSEHGHLSSAPERFVVSDIGWEVLHLELHAPIDFTGRLDSNVPRPVIDGHVMLILRSGGLGGEPSLSQRFEAEVESDGAFALPGLRPGEGQIFALCQDWCSTKTLVEDPKLAGIGLDPNATAEQERSALERAGRRAYLMQRTIVPQVDTPFVVQMERTGSVEVSILGPNGSAVEGATLNVSPNVRVIGVGSWVHPWGEWSAQTGPDGIARIKNLPPEDSLWIHASAEGLQMSAADRDQTPEVEILPGGTATNEIRLEPADG